MELQKCSVGWRLVMSRIREENFLPLPNVKPFQLKIYALRYWIWISVVMHLWKSYFGSIVVGLSLSQKPSETTTHGTSDGFLDFSLSR